MKITKVSEVCFTAICLISYLSTVKCQTFWGNNASTAATSITPEELESDVPIWALAYGTEATYAYDVKILDNSLDTKVANTVHMVNGVRLSNLHYFTYNSGDKRQDLQLMRESAGSKVDNEKCGSHLRQMLQQIKDFAAIVARKRVQPDFGGNLTAAQFKLANVLDSFGRYDSGLLSGRQFFMGTERQCSKTVLIYDGSEQVASRYCMASMRYDDHMSPELKYRKRPLHEADPRLFVGICVPETCHSISFTDHKKLFQELVDSQFKLPESMFLTTSLEMDSLFCYVDSDSPQHAMPWQGRLLVVTLIGWISFMVYANFYWKPSASNTRLSKIMQCANLRDSWADFTGSNEPEAAAQTDRRVELDTLNPIKVICCVCIIYGHQMYIMALNAEDQAYGSNMSDISHVYHFALSMISLVETFQIITSILTAYFSVKIFSKVTARGLVPQIRLFINQCFQLTTSRYLRLIPMYFLMFWFKKSIIVPWINTSYTLMSPLGDVGFNRATSNGACRQESWLSPLLLQSCQLPLSKQCLLQSWSISADMLCIMVLSPIIVLYSRKPRLATVILVLLVAYGVQRSIYLNENEHPSFKADTSIMKTRGFARLIGRYSLTYTSAFQRLIPTAIGLIAGYYLHVYSRDDKMSWPAWMKGPATTFSVTFVAGILIALPIFPILKRTIFEIVPVHLYLYAFTMTYARPLWAFANSIILLRMMTDWKESTLMKASSNKFWRTVTRLNYAILLIHLDILIWFTWNSGLEYEGFILQKAQGNFVYTVVTCIPLSMIIFVTMENPIDKMIRGLLQGFKRDKADDARASVESQ